MVDWFGRWTEEEDYSVYPKEKWCDYDYMAVWIRSLKYEPKTTMENLIGMVLNYYYSELEYNGAEYYAIEDERRYPDTLMIFIPDVEAYVEDSGGLKEFDYWC